MFLSRVLYFINFFFILVGFQHQKCAVSGFQIKRVGHWWTAENQTLLEELL